MVTIAFDKDILAVTKRQNNLIRILIRCHQIYSSFSSKSTSGKSHSCIQLYVTLCTIAHQSPLSLGFSRQEYWTGLPCPPPGDLPNPGIKPTSLPSPALAGGLFTTITTWEAQVEAQSSINVKFTLLLHITQGKES